MKPPRSLSSLVTLLALIPQLALCSPARRALVIGNDTYPGNTLLNARNDARGVDEALKSLGYVSTLVLDVDKRSMASAIDGFAASIEIGDTALVYYAGHGLQVAGENYLVPTDFHVADETDVKYQGYPLSAVLEKITQHGATTQIVILDACRDNPFLGSRSVRGGWASVATSAGTLLAFGTSPGSTASDDPGEGHGLFTKSLLKYIHSQADVEQVFQLVRQEVIQKSNGHQVPWTASSLIGSFHLDPKADVAAPTLQTASLSADNARPLGRARSVGASPEVPRTGRGIAPGNSQEAQMLSDALAQVRGFHFDEALRILRMILLFDPQSSLALRLIGVVSQLLGRSVEAQASLDRAIELNPNDALAYSYRCLVRASEGLDSRSDCQKALLMRDDLLPGHFGLALSLAQSGEKTKAYDEASRSVVLAPRSAFCYELRGTIAAALNEDAQATRDHHQALILKEHLDQPTP